MKARRFRNTTTPGIAGFLCSIGIGGFLHNESRQLFIPVYLLVLNTKTAFLVDNCMAIAYNHRNFFALHYILFFRMRDHQYKLSRRCPAMGVGPGRPAIGSRVHETHICGTVVCSIGVLFLYLFMEQPTSNGVP